MCLGWREEEFPRKGAKPGKREASWPERENRCPLQEGPGSRGEDGEMEEGEGHPGLSATTGLRLRPGDKGQRWALPRSCVNHSPSCLWLIPYGLPLRWTQRVKFSAWCTIWVWRILLSHHVSHANYGLGCVSICHNPTHYSNPAQIPLSPSEHPSSHLQEGSSPSPGFVSLPESYLDIYQGQLSIRLLYLWIHRYSQILWVCTLSNCWKNPGSWEGMGIWTLFCALPPISFP